jgi:hypothetical protein
MWAGWVVAAIALAGAAFMLRFLIALLREGAPSVCYCVVPVFPDPEREALKGLNRSRLEDDWPAVSGQPAVAVAAQGDSPATEPAGIPVRPLRQAGRPGTRIFFRLRIGPPWQS